MHFLSSGNDNCLHSCANPVNTKYDTVNRTSVRRIPTCINLFTKCYWYYMTSITEKNNSTKRFCFQTLDYSKLTTTKTLSH